MSESIRQDLRTLSREEQESFTNTVSGTYRNLANLLLNQNRVLEAQRVLDLLKVQELQDYLRDVRGNNQTVEGIELLPAERQILVKQDAILENAIQLNKEETELRKIPVPKGSKDSSASVIQLAN